MGGALDAWAVFGRDAHAAPLLQRLVRLQAEDGGGFTDAPHVVDCGLQVGGLVVHNRTLPQEKLAVQHILAVTQEIIARKISP
jgi:hypothetical protein